MAQTQTAIELTIKTPAGDAAPTAAQPASHGETSAALRKGPTFLIFTSVTAVTGISSLLAGLVTVALPRIVHDLGIPTSLQFW